MPKKKGGPNKSAAVRELLTQNPKSPVKEILDTMAGKGMKVTPNLVYFLRARMRADKRKLARQKTAPSLSSSNLHKSNTVELVRKVKLLAGELGGLKRLKELTEILAD
jgi:hypothetical protein